MLCMMKYFVLVVSSFKDYFGVTEFDCAELGDNTASFLDVVWSAILELLGLLSDAETTALFSWFSEFPGLMFEEDGDWQTMGEFAADDCAAVEHVPATVPKSNNQRIEKTSIPFLFK